jgi:hypothetical protein
MPPNKAKGFGEKERKFWTFLCDYVSDNQGFVVSEPFTSPLRVECRADSILPKLLESMGFAVTGAGTAERLMPITTTEHRGSKTYTCQNVGPATMAVFQFSPKQFEAEDQSRKIR